MLQEPANKNCVYLYKINKHAKMYAERANDQYQLGKKTTAHKNSLRKKALYDLKTKILEQIFEDRNVDSITLHEIEGREYYCFYIDGWSFHTPVEEWEGTNVEDSLENTRPKEIDSFDKDSESEVDVTLKESLKHLSKEFGLNANDFLEEEVVTYGHRSYPVGWDYLE